MELTKNQESPQWSLNTGSTISESKKGFFHFLYLTSRNGKNQGQKEKLVMGICSRINQSVNKRDNKESECFIADVCVVFCAFLLFLSHSVAFHFVGHIQGVFLTCLKTTLHQDSDNKYGDSP